MPIPGLHAIPADNPGPLTGSGNWTYLVTGRIPTLIDAGVGRSTHVDAIAAALDAREQRLQQIVVTHDHADHVSGVAALLTRWPQARCLKHVVTESRLVVPWTGLLDGQVLPAGDETLRVVQTPGHSPDHICLWHEASRTLFGGDLLIEGGTVVVPGGRGGRLRDYLVSLDRIAALRPLQVLPAHGVLISQPLALIERYSAHRAARERQVLEAVADGADSVAAIVERVYPDLTSDLRSAAAETVIAHLEKLREDGRVVDSSGRVMLIR